MGIAALELFWSLPLLFIGFIFVPVPELDKTFWWILLLSLPVNAAAYILYLHAIRLSPLSLSVPFLAFTPVFMLITSRVILNETITPWGGVGVGMIILGSYVLNLAVLPRESLNRLPPFSMKRDPGLCWWSPCFFLVQL